eukprot:TRINITY_DN46_c0_g1_i1.p1 TRINITY_DN46_c0_g1~~TRINITY_DN46_c0_g1_i1.p1  ORF type:complete len:193 (-),score=39.89 TRINITY_DN46_c0_g1_i1:74-652(-)
MGRNRYNEQKIFRSTSKPQLGFSPKSACDANCMGLSDFVMAQTSISPSVTSLARMTDTNGEPSLNPSQVLNNVGISNAGSNLIFAFERAFNNGTVTLNANSQLTLFALGTAGFTYHNANRVAQTINFTATSTCSALIPCAFPEATTGAATTGAATTGGSTTGAASTAAAATTSSAAALLASLWCLVLAICLL